MFVNLITVFLPTQPPVRECEYMWCVRVRGVCERENERETKEFCSENTR